MSATDYCGEDFTASTFPELCSIGQFAIIIKCFLVLVIVVGNILIIATIRLVKKLRTTHGDVLFAIAVVDLIIGAIAIPLHMLVSFPETHSSVRTYLWKCALIYYTMALTNLLTFDYLTVMCVERFLLIWKPVWYRKHVTRRTIVVTLSCVLALRLAHVVFVLGYNVHTRTNMDKDWSEDECLSWNKLDPGWFKMITPLFVFLEMILCFSLCVVVVLLTKKTLKKPKDTRRMSTVSGGLSTDSRQPTKKTGIMLSLMFVFLLLWLPTIVAYTLQADDIYFSETTYDIIRIIRFTNSAVNAPIYAVARQEFRDAFKYLLTSPPWKWNLLARKLEYLPNRFISKAMLLNRSTHGKTKFYNFWTPSFGQCASTCTDTLSWDLKEETNVNTTTMTVVSIDVQKNDDTSKEGRPLAVTASTHEALSPKCDTSPPEPGDHKRLTVTASILDVLGRISQSTRRSSLKREDATDEAHYQVTIHE